LLTSNIAGSVIQKPDEEEVRNHFWLFDVNERVWYGILYVQHLETSDPSWEVICKPPTPLHGRMKLSIVLSTNVTEGRHCVAAIVAVYANDDDGVLYAEFRG
jgi:hypothetical protein